jgi:hypothetical protein
MQICVNGLSTDLLWGFLRTARRRHLTTHWQFQDCKMRMGQNVSSMMKTRHFVAGGGQQLGRKHTRTLTICLLMSKPSILLVMLSIFGNFVDDF